MLDLVVAAVGANEPAEAVGAEQEDGFARIPFHFHLRGMHLPQRAGVEEQLEHVGEELQRATDSIVLEGATDRTAFFDWFEKEFFREYRPVELEDGVDVA